MLSEKLWYNTLIITINGPGIGGRVLEKNGVSFVIHGNERDRHEFIPHVHCFYSGEETTILIDSQELMKNSKPFKSRRKMIFAIKIIKEYKEDWKIIYNEMMKKDSSIDFIIKT